jgi:hypothetical protein
VHPDRLSLHFSVNEPDSRRRSSGRGLCRKAGFLRELESSSAVLCLSGPQFAPWTQTQARATMTEGSWNDRSQRSLWRHRALARRQLMSASPRRSGVEERKTLDVSGATWSGGCDAGAGRFASAAGPRSATEDNQCERIFCRTCCQSTRRICARATDFAGAAVPQLL